MLLSHFADLASTELDREVVISPLAAAEAVNHPWPGNVRALRNAVLRAAALADGPIGPDELIPEVEQPRARSEMISVPRGTYASMHAALLQKVVTEEGSIRRAARVLEFVANGSHERRERPRALGAVLPCGVRIGEAALDESVLLLIERRLQVMQRGAHAISREVANLGAGPREGEDRIAALGAVAKE